MPDVERLTRKLERKKVSLADLCQLYRASSKIPHICNALAAHEGAHAQLLAAKCASDSKPSPPHLFHRQYPISGQCQTHVEEANMSLQDKESPQYPAGSAPL